jgi:hypothetical protein
MAEPRGPLNRLSDAELEQMLLDLGRQLAFPATPDIAAGIRASITQAPLRRSAPSFSLRHRWVWMTAAIVLLALVGGGALLATWLIGGGHFGDGGAKKGKGGTVSLSGATDYDPQGDEEEVGSKVELAADGDPTGTAWETEHYDSETFEGTKTGPNPGVGVYVSASSPATPARMIVRSPTPGWDAQVFAAPAGPPSDLSGWGEPVGEVSEAEETQEIALDVRQPSTYFLLWLTKASEARDQAGRYQIEISDIKLLD